MAKRGKKYQEALKLVDRTKKYPIAEAVELLKKTSYAKFDATVEIAFKLNIDPRKAEQNLRGAISLPNGTGRVVRVLVIAKDAKAKEALAAGADYAGDVEYLEKIKAGWFEFDTLIATPDMMGELGKLGRLLGPKGLMPNPKTGTVTMEVEKTVKEFKAGKVEYRTDKAGNILVPVGKVSFENVVTFNMDEYVGNQALLKVFIWQMLLLQLQWLLVLKLTKNHSNIKTNKIIN